MTDVPLPLPVDETISAADLAPTPGELIWPRGRAYPALWRNPDAAGQAFHRARFVTNPKKRNLYPGMSRTSGTEAVPGLIEMAEAFVAVERDIETWQRGIAISESSRSPSCKEA